MLNQKKIEIFLTKIRKSLAKQFLEIAYSHSFDKHYTAKYRHRNIHYFSSRWSKNYITMKICLHHDRTYTYITMKKNGCAVEQTTPQKRRLYYLSTIYNFSKQPKIYCCLIAFICLNKKNRI